MRRYDKDGRVRQTRDIRFTYNSKSQIIHAVQPDGFRRWYVYDHRDRLTAWLDDRGNRTQFLYGHPAEPNRVTHVHYPKTKQTVLLLYNHLGHLIGMEDGGRRFYVACDQVGTNGLLKHAPLGGMGSQFTRSFTRWLQTCPNLMNTLLKLLSAWNVKKDDRPFIRSVD
jgi:YD repeat-containing protein